MKKKLAALILVLAMAFTLIPTMPTSAAINFQDTKGHWAESLINQFVQDGYIVGRSDTVFAPDAPMLRSEFATLALRVFPQLADLPTVAPSVSTQTTYTVAYSPLPLVPGDTLSAANISVKDGTTPITGFDIEFLVDGGSYGASYLIDPLDVGLDVQAIVTLSDNTILPTFAIGTVAPAPSAAPSESPEPTATPQGFVVTYSPLPLVAGDTLSSANLSVTDGGTPLVLGTDYSVEFLIDGGGVADGYIIDPLDAGLTVQAVVTIVSDGILPTVTIGTVALLPSATPTTAPATSTAAPATATTIPSPTPTIDPNAPTPTPTIVPASATPTATPKPVGFFTDVPTTHWAYNSIKVMASVGIIQGFGDGTFHPDEYISRQDAAVLVDRILLALGTPLYVEGVGSVTDASTISTYAQVAVLLLVKNGIITGYPDGSFRPRNTITRAEVVAMMKRALDKYNSFLPTATPPPATTAPTTSPSAPPTVSDSPIPTGTV